MKPASKVFLLSMLILSLMLTSTCVFYPVQLPCPTHQHFATADLLPNPWMDSPNLGLAPDFFVEGDSGDFTHEHVVHSDGDGLVMCNWTHEAGTELDFNFSPDPEKPDCKDFVYFSYDLDWPYEKMPKNAYVRISFSIATTGTFAVAEGADFMFKAYVWLIDSSNNWIMVYQSSPPYKDSLTLREISFSYFDRLEVWGGMVQDDAGHQEDPTDTFQIAVGLAPTSHFQSYGDAYPWEYYDGTVSLLVDYLDLIVIGDLGENLERELPVYSEFIAIQEDNYRLRDIARSPTGEFYVASDFRNSDTGNSSLSVMRFRSDCIQNWRTDESDYGDSRAAGIVCDSAGNLYLIGTRLDSGGRLLIMKWNAGGSLEWGLNHIPPTSGQWRAVDIDIGNDDEIYSISELLIHNGTGTPYTTATLQKWTADGDLLWNRDIILGPHIFPVALKVNHGDGLYVLCRFGNQTAPVIVKLDMSGGMLWSTQDAYRTISERSDGGVYAITKTVNSSDSPTIEIHEIGSDGSVVSTSVVANLMYRGLYVMSWRDMAIDEAPDGSVAFLARGDRLWPYHRLLRFDHELSQVGAEILDRTHEECWNTPLLFTVGTNGLAYVVETTDISDSEKVVIAAYTFTDASSDDGLFFIPADLGMVITLSSLGVIGAVTVLAIRSRKNI